MIWLAAGLLLAGCNSKPADQQTRSQAKQQRLSVNPKASQFLIKAQQAFKQKTYLRALALTDSAETYAPELADVFFFRGQVFTALDRYQEAEAAYTQALTLNPGYQGAWLNLGNNAARQGAYRKALQRYRKEQKRYPSAHLLMEMGRAYAGLGILDSARTAYQKAVAKDSTYATAYARLGQSYQRSGALQKALPYVQKAHMLAPENSNITFLLGSLLMETGRLEDAAGYLQQVVARQPSHQSAHYKLGQVLVRLGQKAKAQRYLETADQLQKLEAKVQQQQERVRVNQNDPRAWVELGNLLRKTSHIGEAVKAYQTALYLAPQNLALHNNMANLYLMQGDTTAAVGRYQAILRRDSSLEGVWLNLGSVYAEVGQRQKAEKAWQKVLELNPEHTAAKKYLTTL